MLKKFNSNHVTLGGYICTCLLIALFIFQFIPFWTYVSEDTITPTLSELTVDDEADEKADANAEEDKKEDASAEEGEKADANAEEDKKEDASADEGEKADADAKEGEKADAAAEEDEKADADAKEGEKADADAEKEEEPEEFTLSVANAVSINGYVWFPDHYKELEKYFANNLKYHEAENYFDEILKANDTKNHFKNAFSSDTLQEIARKTIDEAKANNAIPSKVDTDTVIKKFASDLNANETYKDVRKNFSNTKYLKKVFSKTLNEAGTIGKLDGSIDTEYINNLFRTNLEIESINLLPILESSVKTCYEKDNIDTSKLNDHFKETVKELSGFSDKLFTDTMTNIKKDNLFQKPKDNLYDINDIVKLPILLLLLFVLTIIINGIELCKHKYFITPILSIIVAVVCFIQYYSNFVFSLGMHFKTYVTFCILLFIFAALTLIIKTLLSAKEKKNAKTEL